MKKNYFVFIALMLFMQMGWSQHFIAHQVIIGAGGNFNDPDDYVSLSTFNVLDPGFSEFGSVFTQSIQDVAIDGRFAYVAAQDSLAKFDIDTYEKIAIVEAIGVRNIKVWGDELIVSFWYPVTENFVRMYAADDLTLIANIDGLSGDAAGCVVNNQIAYVAIPGAWGATKGKLAKINLQAHILIEEIDLGEEGVNINDLYLQEGANDKVLAVCATPWGAPDGKLLLINASNSQKEVFTYDTQLGRGVAVLDDMLYCVIGNGIGSIDLLDMTISDTMLFNSPGFGFAGAAMDTINKMFYVTTTDYTSTGTAYIFNMNGDQMQSFSCGIDANSIAIDYRSTEGVNLAKSNSDFRLYPNPSSAMITLDWKGAENFKEVQILDIHGRQILRQLLESNLSGLQLDLSHLERGVYVINMIDGHGSYSQRLIKY